MKDDKPKRTKPARWYSEPMEWRSIESGDLYLRAVFQFLSKPELRNIVPRTVGRRRQEHPRLRPPDGHPTNTPSVLSSQSLLLGKGSNHHRFSSFSPSYYWNSFSIYIRQLFKSNEKEQLSPSLAIESKTFRMKLVFSVRSDLRSETE